MLQVPLSFITADDWSSPYKTGHSLTLFISFIYSLRDFIFKTYSKKTFSTGPSADKISADINSKSFFFFLCQVFFELHRNDKEHTRLLFFGCGNTIFLTFERGSFYTLI